MRLYLAPMEGVMNAPMRQLITQQQDFDLCITEFIRVIDMLLPRPVFYRMCPELRTDGKTTSGTPVRVQLLGQDPICLADNAARAIALGSPGIDLNFGCPAKTVNKSKGGAILLNEPALIYKIVSEVKAVLPEGQVLSVKMRLGFNDTSLMIENSQAIADAGASELIVHARTRDDGYKPPAYWPQIKKITQHINIPVIANGEIWNSAHAKQCQLESGCDDLMIGRGVLALPNLGDVIKSNAEPMLWSQMLSLLIEHAVLEMYNPSKQYYTNRVKQWLRFLVLQFTEAQSLFEQVRRLKSPEEIVVAIKAHQLALAKS